ncbi:MAG: TolB family protein, partial [Sphingomicrobium sp.]
MSKFVIRAALFAAFAVTVASPLLAEADGPVPRPAAMKMENVPQVPRSLADATRPYLEYRTANFSGWNAADRSMLVRTRFGNTAQLHSVKAPGAVRRQISFEEEPVTGLWSPSGDVLLVVRDQGGDEFYQLHTLKDGRLTLLTDGKSRNEFGAWSKDGRLAGYSSTRRNGSDSDLYVIDPRNPASDRRVAEVKG